MQEGVLNVCLQAKDRTSFNLNKENFETNLNAPIERAAETDARKIPLPLHYCHTRTSVKLTIFKLAKSALIVLNFYCIKEL